MSRRPPWLERKRNKVRRSLFRRIVLPLFNGEMRRQGLVLYRYDECVDRLRPCSEISWPWITRRANTETPEDAWYAALGERALRADVILDVGGGGGAISTWFSRWAKRVIVFEPSPANRELIRTHHRIRDVRNVEIVACAMGAESGEATLHLKREPGHNSLGDIGASETVDRVRVPVRTLDEFAAERGFETIGLLKIDVEGYEPDVIRGADRLLREQRIELVLFEFSPAFYRQRGIDPCAPVDALEERGYSVRHVNGNEIERASLERGRQTDLIAEPRGSKLDRA